MNSRYTRTALAAQGRFFSVPRGFTLVELVVTLAVVAILAAIALPSFASFTARTQIAQLNNGLVGDIALARAEAAKRGGQVALLAKDGDWNKGWSILPDANGDGAFDDKDGDALRVREVLPPNFKVQGSKTSDASAITRLVFDDKGAVAAPGEVDFQVCREADSIKEPRRSIKVKGSGIVSSHLDTNLGC